MPDLIDIGANLTHDSFDADRDQVIARAVASGVVHQIITGADLASSRRAAEFAATRPAMFSATAGVHPHHAHHFSLAAHGAELRDLLGLPTVVAVGECGLDYYRNFSPRAAQLATFAAQLEIAAEVQMPVFLHQRGAHPDFVALLKDYAPRLSRAVVHCFTDGAAELADYLQLGFSVGITGWICDERRGRHLRDLVADIPASRLMIETDAPYLLPRDLDPRPASRRNEPMHLAHVARAVAAARAIPFAAVADLTSANARTFFDLSGSAAF